MTRPLSIRTRIIVLYMSLLTVVYLFFSIYIYLDLSQFLQNGLRQALMRRADQILSALDQRSRVSRALIGAEIDARYAPELNERVIRVFDPSGNFIYASKNSGLLVQAPQNSLTSLNQIIYREDHLPGASRFEVVRAIRTMRDGTPYAVEVGAPDKEIEVALSNLLMTLAWAFPFLATLGILGGYVLLGRALHPIDEIISAAEIISIKNLSQRLPVVKTGDEFERMSIVLNRMIERLQDAYLVTSRFAADASHQLRTPLTIMRGELEALVHEAPQREDLVNSLGSILEEAERLTKIVEGLLLLSRLEVREAQMARSTVNLGVLVNSIVEQTHLLAEEKDITINRRLDSDILVEADEFRIRQAIINLLDNAIKYTPDGGKITIHVGASQELAFLTVEDTGIGIPPEDLPLVFQRFYRSESVKSKLIPGSGLGLSIVETIAQAHRGSVTVSSRVGKGSTFRFQLPQYLKPTTS